MLFIKSGLIFDTFSNLTWSFLMLNLVSRYLPSVSFYSFILIFFDSTLDNTPQVRHKLLFLENGLFYAKNLCKTATLKKTKNCFSRLIIA